MSRSPSLPSLSSLVLAAAGLYLIYTIHDVLVPFALAFALAYLTNPVINYFEAAGLRRDHVVLSIYLLCAAAVTISANSLIPATTTQLALLQGKAPLYFLQAEKTARALQLQLAQRLPLGHTVVEGWSLKMYTPIVEQLPKLPSYLLGLFPLFSLIFLVPMITFYLLADSDDMIRRAIQICPSRYVEQAVHLISEIDTSLGNYIRGVLIIALAIASASFVGLWLLGVDYALAVAALAGASSLIPYLGAILGAIVGMTVTFFQFHSVAPMFQVLLLFCGIRLADEAFVQPLVSRHAVRLHPLAFLLALLVGGKIFGFVGLLFAIPSACVIKCILRVAWDWYSTEARMAPPPAVYGADVPYC